MVNHEVHYVLPSRSGLCPVPNSLGPKLTWTSTKRFSWGVHSVFSTKTGTNRPQKASPSSKHVNLSPGRFTLNCTPSFADTRNAGGPRMSSGVDCPQPAGVAEPGAAGASLRAAGLHGSPPQWRRLRGGESRRGAARTGSLHGDRSRRCVMSV